jgi:Protein of unknwon function (DUF3008)
MPAKSKEQQSAFALALAARRGDIKPETLSGAASLLYRDKSLTRDDLQQYATAPTERTRTMPQRRHVTAKRG